MIKIFTISGQLPLPAVMSGRVSAMADPCGLQIQGAADPGEQWETIDLSGRGDHVLLRAAVHDGCGPLRLRGGGGDGGDDGRTALSLTVGWREMLRRSQGEAKEKLTAMIVPADAVEETEGEFL